MKSAHDSPIGRRVCSGLAALSLESPVTLFPSSSPLRFFPLFFFLDRHWIIVSCRMDSFFFCSETGQVDVFFFIPTGNLPTRSKIRLPPYFFLGIAPFILLHKSPSFRNSLTFFYNPGALNLVFLFSSDTFPITRDFRNLKSRLLRVPLVGLFLWSEPLCTPHDAFPFPPINFVSSSRSGNFIGLFFCPTARFFPYY